MPNARVTVTLPSEVVHAIDRAEIDRSRFVLQAVTRELDRRRNEQLLQSLRHPHPESREMTEAGFAAWADGLPDDAWDLIDPNAGEDVQWTADRGWVGKDK